MMPAPDSSRGYVQTDDDVAKEEQLMAEHAYQLAKADGRAAERADIVAWLMSRPGLNRCLNVATVAAVHIKDGAHVGAAKKGAT